MAISEGNFSHRTVPSLVPSLKALELPGPLHKYIAGFHFFPHHRALKAETAMKMRANVNKLATFNKIKFNATCLGQILHDWVGFSNFSLKIC